MTEIDPNYELIEKYINGFMWSSDTPEITKTIVAANIRAFYGWSQDNLINERGNRLEAMIDRLAGKNVDLQAELEHYKRVICLWTQENDEYGSWGSSCGDVFFFEEGTPEENNIKFCPFCGKPLAWKAYEPEPEEEE